MAEGKTTGIRLRMTMEMVKKNTIQETEVGLFGKDLARSVGCSSDSCFFCFFLWFLAKCYGLGK